MSVVRSVETIKRNALRSGWVANNTYSTALNARCELYHHTVDIAIAKFVGIVSCSEIPFTVVTNAPMTMLAVITKSAEN